MGSCLWLVVPCYNETEVLPRTAERLSELLARLVQSGQVSADSRICLVDDGSTDGTWAMIAGLHRRDGRFLGLRLSHNRGHQNALAAGMDMARQRADAVITLDADLQDDPEAVCAMVTAWRQGADVVFGVRAARDTDTAAKRGTAHLYYRLMARLGVELVYDHADYRLLSRRALEALGEYGEYDPFWRGLVPQLGLSTARVTYARQPRQAGESKYTLKKMYTLAMDGLTSFSLVPLRLVLAAGVLAGALGAVLLLAALVRAVCGHGGAMLALAGSVWLLGGAILAALGLMGEYVGRIYRQSKQRPRYQLWETLTDDTAAEKGDGHAG